MTRLGSALLALLIVPLVAHAATLSVGLAGDPGMLDPARSGNYIDRDVLAAVCDKLIDTDPEQKFIPELATGWEWSADGRALTLHLRAGVKFQDGTAFDAEAVKANIERDKTLPGTLRRPELAPVSSVEVVDPQTAVLHLSAPDAPLLAVLADRSGMMVSPKAMAAPGDALAQHPVCAGPYTITERVAQDHITVDRFPGYWNAGAIHIDRIIYRPIPDSTVRLVNLQSGQLQIVDQLAPTDVATVKADSRLRVAQHASVGYRTLEFNIAHGPRASGPLARNALVRQAFAKSLDRDALNQVVFNGLFVPNNQTQAPHSTYWDPAHPLPPRDLDGAKALLKQAGVTRVPLTLQLANSPIDGQIGQVIQSMANEAGFDVKLEQVESNAGNQQDLAGDFDVALLNWSGRADPDANLSIFLACDAPFNFGHYCNPKMDALLAVGRATTEVEKRVPIYRQVVDLYTTDAPLIILYNPTWIWGISARLQGFVPNADGLIRPQGLVLAP